MVKITRNPPEHNPEPAEADPPLDPDAFAKAFIRERARRAAREEHTVEQHKAHIRYWIIVASLFLTAVILVASIWDQIKTLFGIGT